MLARPSALGTPPGRAYPDRLGTREGHTVCLVADAIVEVHEGV